MDDETVRIIIILIYYRPARVKTRKPVCNATFKIKTRRSLLRRHFHSTQRGKNPRS